MSITRETKFQEGEIVEYEGEEWQIRYSPPFDISKIEDYLSKKIGLDTPYLLEKQHDESSEESTGFPDYEIAQENSLEPLEQGGK